MKHLIYEQSVLKTSDKIINILAERIKRSGLPLRQYSKMTGYTQAYIFNFINGKYRSDMISLGTIIKFAECLGFKVSLEYSSGKIEFYE